LIDRSIATMKECLTAAGVKPSEVQHIAMTGGVSCMPIVRQRVQQFFGREIHGSHNPQHVVVVGNGVYGQVLTAQLARQKQKGNSG
jgi:molecular chaperone DnaK